MSASNLVEVLTEMKADSVPAPGPAKPKMTDEQFLEKTGQLVAFVNLARQKFPPDERDATAGCCVQYLSGKSTPVEFVARLTQIIGQKKLTLVLMLFEQFIQRRQQVELAQKTRA